MENIKYTKQQKHQTENYGLMLPAILIWGLVILLLIGFFWFVSDFSLSLEKYYLLPWCLLAGLVILSPTFYFIYTNQFDFFNPLIFGGLLYIFPTFVLGGVILAFGWSEPYYLTFIENPQYNLPLSLVYVMIGYLGVIVGYALPFGKFFSKKLDVWMPNWNWKPSDIWFPGLLLLITGIGFNIIGFLQGLIGFQRVEEVGIFDGLLFFLTVFLTEGIIILWLGIFTSKSKPGIFYIVLFILILIVPLKMALQGNRGSLLASILAIAFAFQNSGRKLKIKHTIIIGIVLAIAVLIGMVYGTAFRNIKGSESRINSGDYLGQVSSTLNYLSTKDTEEIISESARTLAERVDNLSALGVVVANYEKLAPYEADFGIQNNIINDLYTSFIPRFIWADKPPTSDARAYSDLYFNYSENSFATTPFGDLLRNFGPVGVPIGMMLIGIYFRLIYSLLIQTKSPAIWKKVSYFVLLTVISFEAFYATIFPTLVRSVILLMVSLFIVNFIIKKLKVSFRTI